MPLTLNALRRTALRVVVVLGLGWLASSCDYPESLLPEVTVNVSGTGLGGGRVRANDPVVPIDCDFPGAACTGSFRDAGLGGSFSLIATPSLGSRFSGWSGCTSVNGNDCFLSFTSAPREFSVTARFDLAPGAVRVTVRGTGTGAGHVSSTDSATAINCDFHGAGECSAIVLPGGSGSFNLVASAALGSAFMAWGGCPSASGSTCNISYLAGGDSMFNVSARFDTIAGALDTLTLYNGTSQIANMVVGSETPNTGNSLTPSTTRKLLIPKAVGTVVSVRAYVGGAQVTSTTCTVTASAWQGALTPLVGLFAEGPTYSLTCYNF